MMGVSRAVQRVVCLERSAAQAQAQELRAELAAKEDAIVQLTAQLMVRQLASCMVASSNRCLLSANEPFAYAPC